MADYLRIAQAALADLKTAVSAVCAFRIESPKIDVEADQAERERAGADVLTRS
jgi:hypothetical protein